MMLEKAGIQFNLVHGDVFAKFIQPFLANNKPVAKFVVACAFLSKQRRRMAKGRKCLEPVISIAVLLKTSILKWKFQRHRNLISGQRQVIERSLNGDHKCYMR